MNSKQSARNEQIRKMVFGSILMAIILIMTFIPQFDTLQLMLFQLPLSIFLLLLVQLFLVEYGFY